MRERTLFLWLVCAILPSCGGNPKSTDELETSESTTETDESTAETDESTTGTEDIVFEVSLAQVKQFDFTWPDDGALYYQLLESVDIGEPYIQVGGDIVGLTTSLTVPLHARSNASYKLNACNDGGCTESGQVDVVGPLVEAIGTFKASNSGEDHEFGSYVVLSGDGNTLAIGARKEDSNATGIDGDQTDSSAHDSGAVYVYVRDEMNGWMQQAYVKASNSGAGDWFGVSVALSEDGNTLAVGALFEASNATGIDGNQADDSTPDAGAVYVYERDGRNVWAQQAYVKASNSGVEDSFGRSVALSGDGSILVVGAPFEASSATGIDGDQADDSAPYAGAAYVYQRDAMDVWTQRAYVKASNTDEADAFGSSVALSKDGRTLAVGAVDEDSSAQSIDGDQVDDSSSAAGAVYVYERDAMDVWTPQAYVKASNSDANDHFGFSVALSADGSTLAVGALGESSNATGVDGNQADDSATVAGAAYVFERDTMNVWTQQAYVKASNSGAGDHFGFSVALSGAGSTLAVGAHYEASPALGIDGDQADDSAPAAGAVYVYERDAMDVWAPQAYVKASNSGASDEFGISVALSGDASTLAVGALGEDSNAQGIGGDPLDDSASQAGAVYLY